MPSRERSANSVGLPFRPFLYTLDQVADMVFMTERELKDGHVYFAGIHHGRPSPHKILFRDVAEPGAEERKWRVAEKELIRWFRYKGFRVTSRASLGL